MVDSLAVRLGLALAIGLLVGLERGWRERESPAGSRTAGIRTYAIVGLLGGVLAALADALASAGVFYVGFLGFAGVFSWFAWREAAADETFSVTGVIAALAVFALGGLAVAGDYGAAAAGGVALAGLLASRDALHGLLKRLTWPELRSALLLAGMTAIVLPLLPDRTVDPWGGVNPWEIWLFTVLTAAISYGGYVAVRVLGPGRGVVVSGLAGALVSSTAVTLAFARRAEAGEPARPLTAGAALAAMVSLLRVLTIVALVEPRVATLIAAPAVSAASIFGLLGAALLARGTAKTEIATKLGNPFDLAPLAAFAVTFAVVAAASAALAHTFGPTGVLWTSAISGVVDVDVASLTAARLAGGAISLGTAAAAILLAVTVNAVARVGLAFAAGPLSYSLPLAAATIAAVGSGAAAFILQQS